jgi:adenosylhomocysteine nucleosidase
VSSSPPPGFVVGLAIEARLLAQAIARQAASATPTIACAAADPSRARDGARRLLREGAGALVSFGIAGGLDPNLAPGDLVLAERVMSPEGDAVATDPDLRATWAAAAAAAGLHHVDGSLMESARILASAAEKRAAHRSSGAVAVDMESRAVAGVAAEAGMPFIAVRAIADPAGRPLPRSVIGSIGPNGGPRVGRVILRVCLRPWEAPALLQLRRDTNAALESLRRLIGGFGPADFC